MNLGSVIPDTPQSLVLFSITTSSENPKGITGCDGRDGYLLNCHGSWNGKPRSQIIWKRKTWSPDLWLSLGLTVTKVGITVALTEFIRKKNLHLDGRLPGWPWEVHEMGGLNQATPGHPGFNWDTPGRREPVGVPSGHSRLPRGSRSSEHPRTP